MKYKGFHKNIGGVLFGCFVVNPFHFWTDELEGRDAASQI